MSLLRDRSFLAAGMGHFVVDMLNGVRPLLVTMLSIPLGMSNAMIGLFGTVYTMGNALAQPLFGWAADRFGSRWIAAGGVLWTSAMFAIALVLPGYASLGFLLLASLGSAAYHPAGAMQATLRGREQAVPREATAASLFLFFGQSGFSVGPALGGPILDHWGMPGLLILLVFTVPVGLNVSAQVKGLRPSVWAAPSPRAREAAIKVGRGTLIALVIAITCRSWATVNMTTFMPKYYSDLGFRPAIYGPLSSLFIVGGAFGSVLGGWLADRVGNRFVLFWSMLLGAIPLGFFAGTVMTSWSYLVITLAGALIGAGQSITVVLAQRMMPSRMGAASGLVLGFTFASGALGTLLSGYQADLAGFDAVFLTTAGIALVGALACTRIKDVPKPVGEAPLSTAGQH